MCTLIFTAGSDFVGGIFQLYFYPGSPSDCTSIYIIDDHFYEDDETFSVHIRSDDGDVVVSDDCGWAYVEIIDDEGSLVLLTNVWLASAPGTETHCMACLFVNAGSRHEASNLYSTL